MPAAFFTRWPNKDSDNLTQMKNNNTDSPNSSSLVLPEKVQRENIWRLSIAQALAGANSVVVYATGAIVGDMLAPTPILATLPISKIGRASCRERVCQYV